MASAPIVLRRRRGKLFHVEHSTANGELLAKLVGSRLFSVVWTCRIYRHDVPCYSEWQCGEISSVEQSVSPKMVRSENQRQERLEAPRPEALLKADSGKVVSKVDRLMLWMAYPSSKQARADTILQSGGSLL